MVSKIEPDRYADTGFAVKDTSAEVNDRLFEAMMKRDPAERLIMGLDMTATARALVWSSIPVGMPECEKRSLFFARFYGETLPSGMG